MSYGFSFPWMFRRGAEMVAAILRGTKAGDIPMEQLRIGDQLENRQVAGHHDPAVAYAAHR